MSISSTSNINTEELKAKLIEEFKTKLTEKMKAKILELSEPELRFDAITYLVKYRDEDPEQLASLILGSDEALPVLLAELISTFRFIEPPTITLDRGMKACQALSLLQTVTSTKEGIALFARCDCMTFVLPFMYSIERGGPLEHLRTAALGVVGSMLRYDTLNELVVKYLVTTPVIPLCLHMMTQNGPVIMTLTVFIVQKILLTRIGLEHCCMLPERIAHMVNSLNMVIQFVAVEPNPRLLRTALRCYGCLSHSHHALPVLKHLLPHTLKDGTFDELIEANKAIEDEWRHLIGVTGIHDMLILNGHFNRELTCEEMLSREMALAVLQLGGM
ncbi:hypothetical protein L596_000764 [Steinernema carpocapsae]|uniref:CCR4-NOT transcription complex subunit 9 n=1 Tax=Steinernema carpocapsae TaxID=34508 RepID=A0A4U8UKD4_STECR|nr:hypothetical protein L596_000764 [Steinernema carpocapsae]